MATIDHVWSILCANAVVDSESNNLSLFNILEQLTVAPDAQLPATILVFFELVTLWSRTDLEQPGTGWSQVRVLEPQGKSAPLGKTPIDLTQFRRFRNRFGIQGFTITGSGKYIFPAHKYVSI